MLAGGWAELLVVVHAEELAAAIKELEALLLAVSVCEGVHSGDDGRGRRHGSPLVAPDDGGRVEVQETVGPPLVACRPHAQGG